MTSETNKDTISVTFVFPSVAGARSVALAGDFNGWSHDQHPLVRQDDESFSITIELAVGRRYQYRYLVDGQEWENDWSADAYVPNEYGGNNSQIDLTVGSPRVAAAAILPTPEPTAARLSKSASRAGDGASPSAGSRPKQPSRKKSASAGSSGVEQAADSSF